MCVLSKSKEPLRTTEDMECYKILGVVEKDKYFTPYRHTFVDITQPQKPLDTNDTPFLLTTHMGLYEFSIGWVFAYRSWFDAKWIQHNQFPHAKIFKCYIPKNTKYVTDGRVIACKELIFLNEQLCAS